MKDETREKLKQSLTYIGLLFLTLVLALSAIFYVVKFSIEQNEIATPSIERPPKYEQPEPTETASLIKLPLISGDGLIINENPYPSDVYQIYSRKLALFGEFEYALLEIKGEFPNEGDHFLSVNVGSESGIYNAIRSSASTLNKELTKENLGAFNNSTNPLDLRIDLMSQQTFATTSDEFNSTKQSTKLLRLWDFIKPQPPAPSITPILVATFNEKAVYEGALNEVNFIYSCKEGKECGAALCTADVGSQCMAQFGEDIFNKYKNYFETN